MDKREADFRSREGDMRELLDDMFQLHIVRFEELAARRNIVKKVPHGEAGSDRGRDFIRRNML